MSEKYRYMTEEGLEALIGEVEEQGMLAPPVYLKEQIMEEVKKSVKPVKKTVMDRKRAKIQLMVYSIKIVGAAAAAIFCLTMIPMDIGGGMEEMGNRRMEEAVEEDVEHYRKESERILNEPVVRDRGPGKDEGFLEQALGKGSIGTVSSIWRGMTGWFGMEERNYD